MPVGRPLLAGVVLAGVVSVVHADVFFVDDDNCPGPGTGTERDPFCLVQDAINAADDGDEIVVAPGEYFESINLLGKSITLRSADGPDVTTLHAPGDEAVVTCEGGEGPATVLEGFTITGSTASGMINLASSPTVRSCLFEANMDYYNGGGGMHNNGSHPTVIDCTFFDNLSYSSGGGIYNVASSPTVINCSFVENDGRSFFPERGFGGGMACYQSSPTIIGCVFTKNTAGFFAFGEGVYVEGGNPTVINCTFAENWLGNSIMVGSGEATLWNCVLRDSFAIWGEVSASYCNVSGGWPGVGNIDADPLFVDPRSGNFRLSFGSPCIDAGDNTALPIRFADLDGNPRLVDDPDTPDTGNPPGHKPIVDMGAYEYQGRP
jgi:hypothetical protein